MLGKIKIYTHGTKSGKNEFKCHFRHGQFISYSNRTTICDVKPAYVSTHLKYRKDTHAHSDTSPGPNFLLCPKFCPSYHGYVSDFTSHSGIYSNQSVHGCEYTLVIWFLRSWRSLLVQYQVLSDSMGGGVIVLCFVTLGLRLGMGFNTITDDEDYDYSGSGSGSGSGECMLNVAAVCCKSVLLQQWVQ